MIIAVDFDGTIVEHKYPAIGKEIPFAIETLKKLQQERHFLILWSVREGRLLEEAVEFCRQRGLTFFSSSRLWLYPKRKKECTISVSKGYISERFLPSQICAVIRLS